MESHPIYQNALIPGPLFRTLVTMVYSTFRKRICPRKLKQPGRGRSPGRGSIRGIGGCLSPSARPLLPIVFAGTRRSPEG